MYLRFRKYASRTSREVKKQLLNLVALKRPRKILFDHLPKCGGSTLNTYLEAHYPSRRTYSTDGWEPEKSVEEFKRFSKHKRYGFHLVKGHLANELIDLAHPECLKITVFREPVDRLVSHYFFAKETPRHYLYPKIHALALSLEAYIESGLSGELRNWYTTHFTGLSLSEAEADPENSVKLAFDNVSRKYDVIGFLDSFTVFTSTLRERAHLRLTYQNKKANVTKKRVALAEVEQSAINKIKQINHLDIELYKRLRDSLG